jgi:hypothetical protein
MRLRTLTAVVPVVAALGLAAPVGSASAQTTALPPIPCYPFPAFCGPGGQPLFPLPGLPFPRPLPYQPGGPISPGSGPHFGPGPVVPPAGRS